MTKEKHREKVLAQISKLQKDDPASMKRTDKPWTFAVIDLGTICLSWGEVDTFKQTALKSCLPNLNFLLAMSGHFLDG